MPSERVLTRHLLAAKLLPWQLGWLLYPLPELSSRRQELLITRHGVWVHKIVAGPGLQGMEGGMLETPQGSLADALQLLHSWRQLHRKPAADCISIQQSYHLSTPCAKHAGGHAE